MTTLKGRAYPPCGSLSCADCTLLKLAMEDIDDRYDGVCENPKVAEPLMLFDGTFLFPCLFKTLPQDEFLLGIALMVLIAPTLL